VGVISNFTDLVTAYHLQWVLAGEDWEAFNYVMHCDNQSKILCIGSSTVSHKLSILAALL